MTDTKQEGSGENEGGLLFEGKYYFRVKEFAELIGCANDGDPCGPGGVGTCVDGECRMPQARIQEKGLTKLIR